MILHFIYEGCQSISLLFREVIAVYWYETYVTLQYTVWQNADCKMLHHLVHIYYLLRGSYCLGM